MSIPALNATGVCKKFKSVAALDEVSLNVEAGESVALLGHNGAGKTTLFRIALGFLPLSSGSINIAGFQPGSREARQAISYLPENVAFPKMLTGIEIVSYYAKLKKAKQSDVEMALEKVDLVEASRRRCEGYSKGMRQRLGLAQALVGNPKLLLLDEPTSGLDPISRQRFYKIIAEISQRGTAVLLSSHGLSEIEAKTDRVAILRKGKLVANAPLSELQKMANLQIKIRIHSTVDNIENIQNEFGGKVVNATSVDFYSSQAEKMKKLSEISNLGNVVKDVEIFPPSLDDIYYHYSTDETVGAAI